MSYYLSITRGEGPDIGRFRPISEQEWRQHLTTLHNAEYADIDEVTWTPDGRTPVALWYDEGSSTSRVSSSRYSCWSPTRRPWPG